MSITVRAPAKINLHLGVGSVRGDGFHPLITVYQAIGIYDDVTVTEADEWSIHTIADAHVDLTTVPDTDDNIAIRAGQLLAAHHGVDRAAHIEVAKSIPVAGGLAGGSADAAAALVALDRLWDLDTSDEILLSLAAELGSDIPFSLVGGTALGTGRGEVVEPLPNSANVWWIVVPHEIGVSTGGVYRHFDVVVPEGTEPSSADELRIALAEGDLDAVRTSLHNDLAVATYALRPDLRVRAEQLSEWTGVPTLLSGSGPTQLLMYPNAESARQAAETLTGHDIAHVLAPAPVAGAHVISYA